MIGAPDVQGWTDALTKSFTNLAEAIARYLPQLVAALVILAAGWLLSAAASALTKWALRRAGLDGSAARTQMSTVLKRAGFVTPPSVIGGQVLFFVLMLAFARAAVETMGLVGVAAAIDSLVAFLPRLIAAGLILLFGLLIGRFAGNLVSSGAATARLPQAPRLGAVTHGLFLLIAGVMALQRLGIETAILVNTVTALVGALAVGMSIGFALGARPLVTHILAGHFLRQSLPADRVLEIRGMRGMIERVGPVDTVLKGDDRSWSISNANLLEEVVTR